MISSRWPVHPRPLEGECLSSWLQRIGLIYGLSVTDLVEFELGGFGRRQRQRNWLDMDPPDKLIEAVAARTGVPVDTIQRTTIAGIRPFLFPYFDSKYFGQNSVLSTSKHSPYSLQKWVLRQERTQHWTACRSCLKPYPNAAFLLVWRLRIMTSCHIHGLMLEPVRITEDSITWSDECAEEAPPLVRALDHRTWQALTTGYVNLPGGSVRAGLWFSLLRTIWDELHRHISLSVECSEQPILSVWATADSFLQTATTRWRYRTERKHSIIVATAIEMIQNGTVFPKGADAKYFRYDQCSLQP